MERSVTLRGWSWRRTASLVLGAGMAGLAALSLRHFYAARFPTSLSDAAACDTSSFFSCANVALAPIAAVYDVPIAFFGIMVGGLVLLGAMVPSARVERANVLVVTLNAFVATLLTLYSLLGLRSLCTPCTLYTVLSLAAAALFLAFGGARWLLPAGGGPADDAGDAEAPILPSGGTGDAAAPVASSAPQPTAAAVPADAPVPPRGLVAPLLPFLLATLAGAYGMAQYTRAREDARTGNATERVVHQYFALDTVKLPSPLSPYWSARATPRFEDAPIHIVEYSDLLCPDCRFFAQQLKRLEREFPGQINVVYQFFPLEARCNDVVTKDLHPAACDVAYMAAYRPALFMRIHDDIVAHLDSAKHSPAWRAALARRYGVEGALTDTATQALVRRLIRTGTEYEKTSDKYAHGIRSTPTLIINGRMIIGTLPDEQMRAIFRALVDQRLGRGKRFMENWVE